MSKIIAIASINMDIVSQVETHPRPGETVKGTDFSYIPGGKGANQAVAAHRLGGTVLIVGKVGRDAFGDKVLDFFKKEDMNVDAVVVSNEHATGAAFVAVDKSSENIIYVSGGANDHFVSADVSTVIIEPGDSVMATLETPIETTHHLFGKARDVGATTILNAAPAQNHAQELFSLADYVIINETELSFFAKIELFNDREDVVKALRVPREGIRNVIVTLGSRGAIAHIDDEIIEIEGHDVDAIDTTAAGDCFVGALVIALQKGETIKRAMEYANASAAICVQRRGASSSLPTEGEVKKFMAKV